MLFIIVVMKEDSRFWGYEDAKTMSKFFCIYCDCLIVGTFYRAPSPGATPFVDVGQRVKAGDTVCIIEAMKLLNEIEAETDGVIQEILVDNGAPVEFGQPLFVIA